MDCFIEVDTFVYCLYSLESTTLDFYVLTWKRKKKKKSAYSMIHFHFLCLCLTVNITEVATDRAELSLYT